MKEKDNIKELFSEKLGNYEAKVDPQLWSNISSQLGGAAGGTTVGGGLSLIAKLIIAAAAVTGVVLTATYLIPSDEKPNNTVLIEDQQEMVKDEADNALTVIEQNNESGIPESNYDQSENNEPNASADTPELPIDIYTEHLASDDDPAAEIDFNSGLLPKTPKDNKVEEDDNSTATSGDNSSNSEGEESNDSKGSTEESNQEGLNETKQETRTIITFNLPNIFAPGGSFNPYLTLDGENLENEVSLDELEDLQVVVLDSYSKVVFRSSDPYLKWDGTAMNGSPLPEGTYIIYLTAITKDSVPVNGSSQLYIQR